MSDRVLWGVRAPADYRVTYVVRGECLALGKGLIANDGESWLKQLWLIQPAFHPERIAAFGALMIVTTLQWIQRWEMKLREREQRRTF